MITAQAEFDCRLQSKDLIPKSTTKRRVVTITLPFSKTCGTILTARTKTVSSTGPSCSMQQAPHNTRTVQDTATATARVGEDPFHSQRGRRGATPDSGSSEPGFACPSWKKPGLGG